MTRLLVLAYGWGAYAFFVLTTLYAIGFLSNVLPGKTIDGPSAPGAVSAALLDLVLLGAFAVQHSVMARPAFKRMWTRVVPPALERSTYVLAASAVLALLFWLWQPLPTVLWSVDAPAARAVFGVLYVVGWATVFVSTFLLGHRSFFGLEQVNDHVHDRSPKASAFRTPALYRYVRHPLYVGFIVAFWSTPTMSAGHLLFAAAATAYIFVGMFFEERDLVAEFGAIYRTYQREVPMIVPFLRRGRRD